MMLLEMASQGFGDRVALRSGDTSLTYTELFRAAGAAATGIADSGAEHVALLDVNSLALPVGLFASAWAGVPFAPLNYRLSGVELDDLLERVAPAYLVTDAERAEALAARDRTTLVAREDFLDPDPAGAAQSGWPMDPDAIAVLLFTSGTTGAPKAALLVPKM